MGIQAPGRSKYGAKRTVVDGHSFASKKEAGVYTQLRDLQKAGEVDWFCMQPKFMLEGGAWRADFIVVWGDGRIEVLDPKGARTATHKRMLRMVQTRYPKLRVREI